MGSKKDGIIMGAIIGGLLLTPSISQQVFKIVDPIVPASYKIFGSFSLLIFGALIGAIVGYFVDR